MNKIYVSCNGYSATGGTELLHQLVYKLNKIKENSAVIFYDSFSDEKGNPTPDTFLKYTNGEYVTEINDDKNSILILPEVFSRNIIKYKNVKIVIWWLSVDNYLSRYGNLAEKKAYNILDNFLGYIKGNHKLFNESKFHSNNVIIHLYQSEYARLFLESKFFKPNLPLSDFLNSVFFQNNLKIEDRDNVILYNPQKGYEVTKELIGVLPDYKWIPLEKMTPLEMRNLMQKSKIYIDFGNHPGKDRIPREAVINGCVVITNRKGSANNNLDIPIDNGYKFENPLEQKEKFVELIDSVFIDFEKHFLNFERYRFKIKSEEEMFENELVIFYDFLKHKLN